MTVPVLQTSTQSARFASTTNWTCNAPAGIQAGDLLLAIFDTNATAGTISLTGWTAGPGTGATAPSIYTLYRIADGSEGATFAFAWNTAHTGSGVVVRISGEDTVGWQGPSATNVKASGLTFAAASITTTVADALLLGICDTGFSASRNFSSPGFTKVVDLNTANQEQIEVHTETFATPGAVGATTWTDSASSAAAVMVLAIYPPVAAAPIPRTLAAMQAVQRAAVI